MVIQNEREQNTHSKGGWVKIPLLPDNVGKTNVKSVLSEWSRHIIYIVLTSKTPSKSNFEIIFWNIVNFFLLGKSVIMSAHLAASSFASSECLSLWQWSEMYMPWPSHQSSRHQKLKNEDKSKTKTIWRVISITIWIKPEQYLWVMIDWSPSNTLQILSFFMLILHALFSFFIFF